MRHLRNLYNIHTVIILNLILIPIIVGSNAIDVLLGFIIGVFTVWVRTYQYGDLNQLIRDVKDQLNE